MPNPKIPTMRARTDGPWTSTVTASLTRKPNFCAVAASIETSPPDVGSRPATVTTPANCLSGWAVTPSVGAPWVSTALPEAVTSCAYPVSSPSATRTPGTSAIRATSEPGTRWGVPTSPPNPPLNFDTPLT